VGPALLRDYLDCLGSSPKLSEPRLISARVEVAKRIN
jgi:hypothetical protein